jgi:hypothetical protein
MRTRLFGQSSAVWKIGVVFGFARSPEGADRHMVCAPASIKVKSRQPHGGTGAPRLAGLASGIVNK